MVARRELPTRRPSENFDTEWNGIPLTVTVGYYPNPDGIAPYDMLTPGEIFAETLAEGQISDLVDDGCRVISIAMQHGATPADLAHSLGRTPNLRHDPDDPESGPEDFPASPIGAVLAAVLK
jgi:hypothetical protein